MDGANLGNTDVEEQPAEAIDVWLARRLGQPVALTFTQNRSTMMSWRVKGGCLQLRLHSLFTRAPEEIWECIALYLQTSDRRAGKLIDRYIAEFRPESRPAKVVICTQGRVHDLEEIFNSLNNKYFHGACRAMVTWGRESPKRTHRRRSIILGSFSQSENLIRMHPSLDQDFVPRYYVGSVLFHEMIHEVLGVEEVGGRRQVHPPEFVVLEEGYADYARAQAWQRANLGRLLAYGVR